MVMQGDAAGSESNANAVDRNQQLTNALNPKKTSLCTSLGLGCYKPLTLGWVPRPLLGV